ncbi:hypothetical protein LF935_06355, partial [Pectobacterium carotovorum]|uniref:hypothetical protein n=1 Tax=Pectobacterium carotovorum TaxID=554 RepID=UPI001CF4451B
APGTIDLTLIKTISYKIKFNRRKAVFLCLKKGEWQQNGSRVAALILGMKKAAKNLAAFVKPD